MTTYSSKKESLLRLSITMSV